MFFANNKSVGVNISDFSVKVVEAVRQNGEYNVTGAGYCELEPGAVKKGRIVDEEKLKSALLTAMSSAKPKLIKASKIVFNLPESQTFVHIFRINAAKKEEIAKAVREEAFLNIPISKEELTYSYKIIREYDQKKKISAKVIILAANKSVLDEWKVFFQNLKMEFDAFDLETIATFRGLSDKYPVDPLCIVDIGAFVTNIAIFLKSGLYYSYSFYDAGNNFTQKIREGIERSKPEKLKEADAENLKREIGLAGSDEYDISVILKGALLPIINEIKVAADYLKESAKTVLGEVVVIGGSSKTKGLEDYIRSNLSGYGKIQETEDGEAEGQPAVSGMKVTCGSPVISGVDVIYTEALGLALKGLDKAWSNMAPALPVESESSLLNRRAHANKNGKNDEGESAAVDVPDQNDADEEEDSWIKSHRQELMLASILFFGALAVGWAFWYRSSHTKPKDFMTSGSEYSIEKNLEYKVEVFTGPMADTAGKIPGRLATTTVEAAKEYSQAKAQGEILAREKLKTGEFLWPDPLNSSEGESVIYPLTMEWLIYSENEARSRFLSNVKEEVGQDSSFILNKIDFIGIEIATSSKYFLLGKVSIYMDASDAGGDASDDGLSGSTETVADPETDTDSSGSAVIEPDSQNPISEEDAAAQELRRKLLEAMGGDWVRIIETGSGWLNIRNGPGTQYEVIGRAKVGDEYQGLDKDSGWVRVLLFDGTEGWVSEEYVSEVAN